MAERCKNCGAELFAGQQFCRFCGARTAPLPGGEMPTQILPPDKQTGAQGTAAQRTAQGTDPSLQAPPTSYYAPPPAPQAYAPPAAAPAPRRRSLRRWLVALLVVAFAGAAGFAALLYAVVSRKGMREVRIVRPAIPKKPDLPPEFQGMMEKGEALGEEGADISDDKTTITRSFPLGAGAVLSLRNVKGDIHVEGWDEQRAEVKIVKHGGSEEERAESRVTATSDGKRLALGTAPAGGEVAVDYEIKLPRNLDHLEINSVNSDVELSDIGGSVAVNLQRGDVNLEDVGGVVKTNVVKGKTVVTLKDAKAAGGREPYNVSAVSGDIELNIQRDVNADIKAEVVSGKIDVDDDFGFKVEKRPIGEHVIGKVGAGGKPIVLKVVNGTIKIQQ